MALLTRHITVYCRVIQQWKIKEIWNHFHGQKYLISKWFSNFKSTGSKIWLYFKGWFFYAWNVRETERIVFFVHFLMLYVVYFTLKNKSILCRMIVSGASGAQSRNNKVQSRADEIRAIVYLNANETLFISVGQMGSSVCQYTGVSHRLKTLSVTNYSGQKHPTAAGHVGQKPARLSWNGASSACNSKGWPN